MDWQLSDIGKTICNSVAVEGSFQSMV